MDAVSDRSDGASQLSHILRVFYGTVRCAALSSECINIVVKLPLALCLIY